MPSLFQRSVTFTKALWRHAQDGLRRASEETLAARAAICERCPDGKYDAENQQCTECGCNCSGAQQFLNKLAWLSESCPLGHWGASGTEMPPPRLTVGMACYDDFDGVYFTVQALRTYHAEVMADAEILVVDNAPHLRSGQRIAHLLGGCPNGRYIAMPEPVGTSAPRDRVFREAKGDYVVCIDSHVLLWPGSLARLIRWYDAHPDCRDLIQGPLVYDNFSPVAFAGVASHMDPVWRDNMFGTWAGDSRAYDLDAEPFEIPMHGLGLFSCRRDAWLGFNPHFRGFGGEEGYIHAKYRQAGRRTLCLPFLRWIHRFNESTPYPNIQRDRIRNYVLGWEELGLDLAPIREHFFDSGRHYMHEWQEICEEALALMEGKEAAA